jgi:hypothetical protein
MRVRVHRNLHKKCWSIVDPKTGRVIEHTNSVTIQNATFVVRPGGRSRALRERKRNVHAFVVGDLVTECIDACCNRKSVVNEWSSVRYNPFKAGTFMCHRTDRFRPIKAAPLVRLDNEGAWVPSTSRGTRSRPSA